MNSRAEAAFGGDPTYPPLIRRGIKPETPGFIRRGRFIREEADEYLITSPGGEQTVFLKWKDHWKVDRQGIYYRNMIFGDQFDASEGYLPIAGGEENAFAPGKVVLEIGSGFGVALAQYAKTYNRTTFIGIDQYYEYEGERTIDFTKQGDVQLIKDDWTSLSSLRRKSVDTIISVQSVFPFGIDPIGRPNSEEVADAISRVAKPGAIWRFDIDPLRYMNPEYKDWLEELLSSRGWELTFTYTKKGYLKTTVVAQKTLEEDQSHKDSKRNLVDAYEPKDPKVTHQLPTDPPTAYRNESNGFITGSNIWTYRLDLFNDEYELIPATKLTPEAIKLRKDTSTILEGGESVALAAGRKVLDLGSGRAVALQQFAKEYPDTTFIGVDLGYQYEDERTVDLNKPGMQLIKDDWTSLTSLDDKSIDTILDYNGSIFWGLRSKDEALVLQTLSRVAKPGAILRYNLEYDEKGINEYNAKRLKEHGWDIKFFGNTAVARKI